MKLILRTAFLALPNLVCWYWLVLGGLGHESPAVPLLPTSQPVSHFTGFGRPGILMAPPGQVLRAPQAARIEKCYWSAEQRVRTGQLLLRVALKPFDHSQRSYWVAPAAGEIIPLGCGVGDYLAARVPYARLRLSSPLRVLVTGVAAAGLLVGDSLVVQVGPAGLVGAAAPLTAVLPGADDDAKVLVINNLRWPRDTTARVVLAALRPAGNSRAKLALRTGK